MPDTVAFSQRLYQDPAFRQRFADDPAGVLREAGLDPDRLALPDKIDAQALGQKLDALAAGGDHNHPAQASAGTDPQRLWDHYGAIAFQPGAAADGDPTSISVAIVVYGTSMVTSTASPVVTTGRRATILSVEQLAALRTLARKPLTDVRFDVAGSDGSKVVGLDADAVRAFLDRDRG